jgi:hypothetical protein
VLLRRSSGVCIAPDGPRVTAVSPSFWHGSGMHLSLASSPSLEGRWCGNSLIRGNVSAGLAGSSARE